MATIGIKHPVYAVISAMNANAKPTYNASKSGILGKATKADVTLNFAEGSLYADDALDISAEIKVMEGMLAQEGLKDDPISSMK